MPVADVLTKESLAEADVILNRTNIALARSRKLIESWMLAPKPDEDVKDDDSDDDFTAESETAGLGSKVQTPEKDAMSGLPRARISGKDSLLEQILGKRGAREHLKAHGKPMSKPTGKEEAKSVKRSRPQTSPDDSDDEEESRTAMVGRRKPALTTLVSKGRPSKMRKSSPG